MCLNCFGAGKAGAAEQYGDSVPLEGTSLMARGSRFVLVSTSNQVFLRWTAR